MVWYNQEIKVVTPHYTIVETDYIRKHLISERIEDHVTFNKVS